MPSEVVRLGRRYMDQPTFMRADQEEHETAPTVAQYFFQVHRMDKPRILARLLQTPERGGCFVFVRTKAMADRLVRDLEDLDVSAVAVHGDLRQVSREKNLQKFRDAKADVLVATEVAARGLDVDNVSHVVNYDCPDDEKMYLHRIGRTARAGSKGVAITFAQFNETERMNLIRKALGQVGEPVREVFSTSDELTELFDLPAETPWQRKGGRQSIAPQSDLPIGKVAGTGPAKKNGGASRERSRARSESKGDKKEASGTRNSSRVSSSGPTHESTTTERTRTRERARTREEGDGSDEPDTSSRRGSSSQRDTSSRRSDRSPSRARDQSSSARKRGGRTSQSESRSRGKGKPSSDKSSNGNRRRSRPTVEEARGAGQPRPRRRVQVEHLP
jgi:superfamily II DNA/RNA helicase